MDNCPSTDYIPVFEIGVIDDNPAVQIIGDYSVCPTTLAAFVVTLFETTMKSVEESDQIAYEKYFTKAFKILMRERHNYEITYKRLISEDTDNE